MAQCMNYKTNKRCPAIHECVGENEHITGCESVEVDGKNIEIHTVTNKGISKERAAGKLERYCFYCMATKRGKKIGNKGSWTGSTPKWCPAGRDKV